MKYIKLARLALFAMCMLLTYTCGLAGEKRLHLSTESIPCIIYENEKTTFYLTLCGTFDPPQDPLPFENRPKAKRSRASLKAKLTFVVGKDKTEREISVPAYSDQSIAVPFVVDMNRLAKGDRIRIAVFHIWPGSDGTPDEEAEFLVMPVRSAEIGCKVSGGRVADKDGNPLLLTVEPFDGESYRRWQPLKEARHVFSSEGKLMIVGSLAGSGVYVKSLCEMWREHSGTCLEPVLTGGEEDGVLTLLVAAINAGRETPDELVLFPGGRDVANHVAPDDYYMVLSALASRYDAGLTDRPRLLFASPLICPDSPHRSEEYVKLTRRVARERRWMFVDMAGVCDCEGVVLQFDPGKKAHIRIAEHIFRRARASRLRAVPFVLAGLLFFVASVGAFWLFSHSRYHAKNLKQTIK